VAVASSDVAAHRNKDRKVNRKLLILDVDETLVYGDLQPLGWSPDHICDWCFSISARMSRGSWISADSISGWRSGSVHRWIISAYALIMYARPITRLHFYEARSTALKCWMIRMTMVAVSVFAGARTSTM